MAEENKPVSRILTGVESGHLYRRFEEVHCYKKDENGDPVLNAENECVEQCPGWDWNLETVGPDDKPIRGGCKYKKSARLCEVLKLAAEGHYVVEVRPKNEADVAREKKLELRALEDYRRRLIQEKADLDERLLALESKMRSM